jgi:hypothetical protein
MFLSARNRADSSISFSYPDVLDWKEQAQVFESLAAYQAFGFTLTTAGTTERLDDMFTASLMTKFYSHLTDGTDIETALQRAKLDMLNRFGEKAAPVYWAGFFLSGDGNRRIAFK